MLHNLNHSQGDSVFGPSLTHPQPEQYSLEHMMCICQAQPEPYKAPTAINPSVRQCVKHSFKRVTHSFRDFPITRRFLTLFDF